ncbi:MAG: serine/threonine protein kinase [Gammaproteobacteria bacterium]|nr:serine/threonine protein kinase [Gammaproteobacteria bacterium]
MDQTDAFQRLSPDDILNAIELTGYQCSGHIYPLNSYENRVYQVGLEGSKPIIAKFYRPGRWTDEAIVEEHNFTLSLKSEDLPVISPLLFEDNTSLRHTELFRFSLYESVGGRTPELDNTDRLKMLGRTLARIHNFGATDNFTHRRQLNVADFAEGANRYLLDNNFIPVDLLPAYESIIDDIINQIKQSFETTGRVQQLRIHGDFHLGNILWRDDIPFIVDFDDTMMGPAIQDIWMLLSGDREYMTARLKDILDGYCEFRDFDPVELSLIEALRTLRIIHYAGWIAKRWHDPAFPIAFPWFNTQRYWQDHILALREQIAAMEEPPLIWDHS